MSKNELDETGDAFSVLVGETRLFFQKISRLVLKSLHDASRPTSTCMYVHLLPPAVGVVWLLLFLLTLRMFWWWLH